MRKGIIFVVCVILGLCINFAISSATHHSSSSAASHSSSASTGSASTPVPDSSYPYGNNPTKITNSQYNRLPYSQQKAMSKWLLGFDQIPVSPGNITALLGALTASGSDWSTTSYGIPAEQDVGGWALSLLTACGGSNIPQAPEANLYLNNGATCSASAPSSPSDSGNSVSTAAPNSSSSDPSSSDSTQSDSAPAPAPLPVLITTTKSPGFNGIKPSAIGFSGDATNIVSNITWTSWTATEAIGNGTWGYNNCLPSCAAGTVTSYPATVMLSNPVGGAFTALTETTSGPAGFTNSYTYPSNWPSGALP